MKISELKDKIFRALCVTNTQELKTAYPDLVKRLDLRTKKAWEKIEKAIDNDPHLNFQQILVQAKEKNQLANQNVNQALDQWENFKKRTLAETEAEINGKLSHLSDYTSSHPVKKTATKKRSHPKVIQFKK